VIAKLLLQCAVSFVSVVAFSILFHAPRAQWVYCGLTGMVGWGTYWVLMQYQSSQVVASLFASILLTLLARIFAVVQRCPTTVYLTGGIFPLVPGAGIYYTVYYFILGDSLRCLEKGVETIKIAAVIAIGLVLVLAIPPDLFHLFRLAHKLEDKRSARHNNH
jgi:uncharacterized membrane protein YjjB (DUF3815 family)